MAAMSKAVLVLDEMPGVCADCPFDNVWGAGSRCGHDGHYIGYVDTWDDWCKHWRKDRRAPGEIGVYDSEVD